MVFLAPRAVPLAAAASGFGLLLLVVRREGWPQVLAGLMAVGPWFGLVLALGGIRYAARAGSWVMCAGGPSRQPLPFRAAWPAFLAGDALGNVTPLGLLASEPAKLLLTRQWMPPASGMAAIAADNAVYTASVVLVIAAGALRLLTLGHTGPQVFWLAAGIVTAAVLALAVAAWTVRRRPAALSAVAQQAARLSGRADRSPDFLREVERTFYALLDWPARRLLGLALWQALFHVAAVLEVWLILRLLPATAASGLSDAFVLETTGRFIIVAFKFVPYRLGIDEAGAVLVAGALRLDPAAAITVALVRKVRTLGWNAVGLAILARHRRLAPSTMTEAG